LANISALILGERRGDAWFYRGKVGSGFTEAQRRQFYEELVDAPPLDNPPADGPEEAVWRLTALRCLVRFFEQKTGDGWVGSFYPDNAKPQDFLPLYAEHFNTVEIDSTFYRMPTAQTVKQWRERTPEGFVFAAKIPQTITHEKVLIDVQADLKAFLKVMDILGDRLGPLLFQFPYFNKNKFRSVGFFLERLAPFLASLPKGYQWVVEVRNKNWLSEKLYSVLRKHGVGLALVDQAWMPRPKINSLFFRERVLVGWSDFGYFQCRLN
jgi:hypothetical protein